LKRGIRRWKEREKVTLQFRPTRHAGIQSPGNIGRERDRLLCWRE
jgi:hypothetical protein